MRRFPFQLFHETKTSLLAFFVLLINGGFLTIFHLWPQDDIITVQRYMHPASQAQPFGCTGGNFEVWVVRRVAISFCILLPLKQHARRGNSQGREVLSRFGRGSRMAGFISTYDEQVFVKQEMGLQYSSVISDTTGNQTTLTIRY